MVNMKKIIFALFMQNFIELYELLMPCQQFTPKCFHFQKNNQNIQMFGVPEKNFAIGYVHNDNLPLGNIALQYVIQNNCRMI